MASSSVHVEEAWLQNNRETARRFIKAMVDTIAVVKQDKQAFNRAFTAAHVAGELAGARVEGRRSPREVTIFKSLGLAVEDVLAAELVYRRAVEQGVGVELEL